ncbi:hypothetical protein E4P41_00035 [Geodermatophilus sp. DF01-2]|uniref:YveK family protein n=1 Tax=Geodermatophilus sp. DF01-2 TaxID=2559610 RepID=UPI0010738837|nr:Wzz/FepE/Etk N-terminal domain-containing protein [Geodermatophilus sp. DF01_2]TFV64674.1 hypothetical protein E4P41_00035 [Geodermatophilus sp. DF01_2]
MQLREVLHVVRQSWLIIVATVVVALAAGWAVTTITPASYEAETQILVTPAVSPDTGGNAVQAAALVSDQVATYAALAETPAVLDPAIERSGVDVVTNDLVEDVSAEVIPQTSIILLTVAAESATDAAELANAIAASLIEQLEGTGSAGSTPTDSAIQATGTVVAPPEIPEDPDSPDLVVNLIVAFAIGLVVAFLVIVFRQALAAGTRGR